MMDTCDWGGFCFVCFAYSNGAQELHIMYYYMQYGYFGFTEYERMIVLRFRLLPCTTQSNVGF